MSVARLHLLRLHLLGSPIQVAVVYGEGEMPLFVTMRLDPSVAPAGPKRSTGGANGYYRRSKDVHTNQHL